MSGREWKPGDVAMVTWRHRRRTQPFTEHIAVMTVDGDWAFEDGRLDGDSEARPLVVIDPEDRETVASLMRLYYRDINGQPVPASAELVVSMQAALRDLADPRPPEPIGLGAVVADADGQLWVRTDYKHPWCATYDDDSGESRDYAHVAAVRVLSEGVTP